MHLLFLSIAGEINGKYIEVPGKHIHLCFSLITSTQKNMYPDEVFHHVIDKFTLLPEIASMRQ